MYKEYMASEEDFRCVVCLERTLKVLLDFGDQPFSNRFVPLNNTGDSTKSSFREATSHAHHRINPSPPQYRLRVGSCISCLTVQLIDPPPPNLVRVPNGGVTYTEPEQHLDDVADFICSFTPIGKSSQILGLSPIDGRLLQKLKNCGFSETVVLRTKEDLHIGEVGAGIETIQERVTRQAEELHERLGASRLVVARAIVEHSHDLQGFLSALKTLAGADGYLLLEVPDCERDLHLQEYSSLWEEHTIYFTKHTLGRCLELAGLETVRFKTYTYPYESISSVLVKSKSQTRPVSLMPLQAERELINGFKDSLQAVAQQCRKRLKSFRVGNNKIAVFGAGHLAVSFINLLQLTDCIDLVIDDNPLKQGLAMPGSLIPIVPSSALQTENVRLCLLSLSYDSEIKVSTKNQVFRSFAGEVRSIFRASPNSIFQ
ncbi:MAG: class I SAM-dependent methyltransferase [Candidatus Obscuribacterales bacterium]|nr:class I SAM-dependent methyltransferase [Candidatus Obscuribacterales bacterium]